MKCPNCYKDISFIGGLKPEIICNNCDYKLEEKNNIKDIFRLIEFNIDFCKITKEGRNDYLGGIGDSPYEDKIFSIFNKWWVRGWTLEREETEEKSSFFARKKELEEENMIMKEENTLLKENYSTLSSIISDLKKKKYRLGMTYRKYLKSINIPTE